MPAASPSTPSIRLNALVRPTSHASGHGPGGPTERPRPAQQRDPLDQQARRHHDDGGRELDQQLRHHSESAHVVGQADQKIMPPPMQNGRIGQAG